MAAEPPVLEEKTSSGTWTCLTCDTVNDIDLPECETCFEERVLILHTSSRNKMIYYAIFIVCVCVCVCMCVFVFVYLFVCIYVPVL